MMLTAVTVAALAASPYRPLPAPKPFASQSVCAKESKLAATSSQGGVANLPFAMGKTFDNLDAYLKHLECFAGPIDKPWWKETRPGVYQHVKTATNAQPETATRDELMKKFGFTR
jgi:hypothetical protein